VRRGFIRVQAFFRKAQLSISAASRSNPHPNGANLKARHKLTNSRAFASDIMAASEHDLSMASSVETPRSNGISNILAVKTEITFFMEKLFQFSFVYIGSIFAVLAGTKSDLIQDLSKTTGLSSLLLISMALLLLNLIYLVIALQRPAPLPS
jgi:hypothetical protein